MTRRLTALALALVLALSLTGCWEAEPEPDDFWNDDLPSPSEEEPQREPAQISDFTLSYLSGQTFDPVTCIDGVQQTVGALLYEPLFTLDNSFAPQPVLCEHSRCDADVDLRAAQRSHFRRHGPHRERRARGLPPRGGVRALRRALCERRLDEGAGRAYTDRHADASKRQLPRPAGHSHRQGRHGERPRSARHRPLRLHNSSRRRGADRKSPLARQLSAARAHRACRGQGQRHRAEPVRLPQRPLPLSRSDRHRRSAARWSPPTSRPRQCSTSAST